MMKLDLNLIRKRKDLIMMGGIVVIILGAIIFSNPDQKTPIKDVNDNQPYVKTPYTGESTETTLSEKEQPPAEGDIVNSEGIRKLYQKYPWYTYIPIDTPEYTVVYDFQREQFRIFLKVPETSAQDVKDQLVAKALDSIRKIGYNKAEIPNYVIYQK